MNKISEQQVAELLTDAASTLRQQQTYIHELETKVAGIEHRDRVTKIAQQMHSKGLELDSSVESLVSRLEKSASSELSTLERAVDLVGPDMGQKIAQLNAHDESVVSGSSDLERFIVGQAG